MSMLFPPPETDGAESADPTVSAKDKESGDGDDQPTYLSSASIVVLNPGQLCQVSSLQIIMAV